MHASACITRATLREDGAPTCITRVMPQEGRNGSEVPDGMDACSSMYHGSYATRGKGQFGIAGQTGCMLKDASQERREEREGIDNCRVEGMHPGACITRDSQGTTDQRRPGERAWNPFRPKRKQ
jgi:hypothetical protein